jgi:hypothetical protein
MFNTMEEVHSSFHGTTITEPSQKCLLRASTIAECTSLTIQISCTPMPSQYSHLRCGSTWLPRAQSLAFMTSQLGTMNQLLLTRPLDMSLGLVWLLTSSMVDKNAEEALRTPEVCQESTTSKISLTILVCRQKMRAQWHVVDKTRISQMVVMVTQ